MKEFSNKFYLFIYFNYFIWKTRFFPHPHWRLCSTMSRWALPIFNWNLPSARGAEFRSRQPNRQIVYFSLTRPRRRSCKAPCSALLFASTLVCALFIYIFIYLLIYTVVCLKRALNFRLKREYILYYGWDHRSRHKHKCGTSFKLKCLPEPEAQKPCT